MRQRTPDVNCDSRTPVPVQYWHRISSPAGGTQDEQVALLLLLRRQGLPPVAGPGCSRCRAAGQQQVLEAHTVPRQVLNGVRLDACQVGHGGQDVCSTVQQRYST